MPPGSAFPLVMYGPAGQPSGPGGLVIVVPTAADESAAIAAGFSTTPEPGLDYSVSWDAQDVQFATFNYLSIYHSPTIASQSEVDGFKGLNGR